MWAGSTLTNKSGSITGTHQKIDRVARNNVSKLLGDDSLFPKSKKILYFEGKNGPDGIKRKSPAVNEPWHFFNPFDDKDTALVTQIKAHYDLLVAELKKGSAERVAFEAAWLSHAIVDGLTPAHHYPYETKLSELRGGEGNETRSSIKQKVLLPGDTRREQLKNNWKMYGHKGLISTHGMFEFGVAAIIAPLGFADSRPTHAEIDKFQELGIAEWFTRTAREIAVLDMYTRYYKRGWTTKLTLQVRNKLLPDIIRTVTLDWYCALIDAKVIRNI